jgi:enamine deaminase RidA (YjgF/YER057c/UK114 family)
VPVIATSTDTAAAPPSCGGELTGSLNLAALAREPGINDWQAPAPALRRRGAEMQVETREDRMPRQIITTANAPASPLYSQGVKAGPYVLVSGIVGIDPATGSLAGDTIQDQTRQALTNCEAILQAGGASLDDVLEVGVLLASPASFAGLNEEYRRWYPSDPPTRYVAKLGVELPGLLVSIRMTAYTG